LYLVICFYFQAEDGIRDFHVTGVQTCALPISGGEYRARPAYATRVRQEASPHPACGAAPRGPCGPLHGVGETAPLAAAQQIPAEDRKSVVQGRGAGVWSRGRSCTINIGHRGIV